jgi:hypothetical protein
MNARQRVDKFLDWSDVHRPSIRTVSVYVRTETFRRLIGAKAVPGPMVYRGRAVRCLGSAPWRQKHPWTVA